MAISDREVLDTVKTLSVLCIEQKKKTPGGRALSEIPKNCTQHSRVAKQALLKVPLFE